MSGYPIFTFVPWHYKSGQTSDFARIPHKFKKHLYHDITNPGKPQTFRFRSLEPWWSTMTLQIRANLRQARKILPNETCRTMTLQIRANLRLSNITIINKQQYHDITNPGKPQTQHQTTGERYRVPWHYKSGQTSDYWVEFTRCIDIVPWHYKSGQTSDPLLYVW